MVFDLNLSRMSFLTEQKIFVGDFCEYTEINGVTFCILKNVEILPNKKGINPGEILKVDEIYLNFSRILALAPPPFYQQNQQTQ